MRLQLDRHRRDYLVISKLCHCEFVCLRMAQEKDYNVERDTHNKPGLVSMRRSVIVDFQKTYLRRVLVVLWILCGMVHGWISVLTLA